MFFKNKIKESEFENWRIKKLLSQFIQSSDDIDKKLIHFYHLYCGVYNREREYLSGYKFLGNLGLNYFYWMEEGYLKTTFGKEWISEYEKCKVDFDFYHQQLCPIAEVILEGIETGEITFLNIGEYIISDKLKIGLESNHFFKIKHKSNDRSKP